MKKGLGYYVGTILIIVSLIGLFFTFYPVIKVYYSPTTEVTSTAKGDGFILSIPKIKAEGIVKKNIDPFNQAEYKSALKEGIAHAKGTYLPGENGTIFLFAHSSGLPWELTHYNTIFLRLGELNKGDEIRLQYKGEVYQYKVREKKEVWPQEVSYLLKTDRKQIILQTCTPIGTDLKRLLVFADPVEASSVR